MLGSIIIIKKEEEFGEVDTMVVENIFLKEEEEAEDEK
jgi:hypothetical protein